MTPALPRLLLAAFAVGLSFTLAFAVAGLPGPVMLAWKGGGVALLAAYAATRARDTDGRLLAAVMALGALGDVLIDALGATAGGGAFLLAHVVAVVLYARSPRPRLGWAEKGVCIALPLTALAIAVLFVPREAFGGGVALYVLGVSTMAAFAFASRFRRDRAALGAVMFLASDLLIVTHLPPAHEARTVSIAVWLLYFVGQALITMGVSAEVGDDDPFDASALFRFRLRSDPPRRP